MSRDETEDRELDLAVPIHITSGNDANRPIKTGYITVSAHQIQFMHVDLYRGPSEPAGSQNQGTG